MLGLLARARRGADVSWSPLDDRWYTSIGGMRADSGATVVPEAALSIAVVYRAINVLAHAVASVPLVIYRRLPDEGKERAREHPQYDLLHDRPNPWMTSFRWRHLVETQAILYGNHYSEIVPGRGGIGALVPLPPDGTRVVDQLADGRLVYLTRTRLSGGQWGPERRLIQDYVFHRRGFSLDGYVGLPLSKFAKNAMGLALSAERHGSMFLRRGATMRGYLSSPVAMDENARREREKEWNRQYGGEAGVGGTPIITGGVEFKSISQDNSKSQWIEARTFQLGELLRFLGVPGVLCGHADNTTTYASAEQQFLHFVTYTVMPATVSFAAELNGSVVTDTPEYFADFRLEGLLRGDISTRYTAHQLAIQGGWKTRNEVRLEENYNRGPKALDEFLEPLNMAVAGEREDDDPDDPAPAPGRQPPPPPPGRDDEDDEDDASAQLATIARRTVERLARREAVAIAGGGGKMGAARRFAGNSAGWRAWLMAFYAEHASLVAGDLGIDAAAARAYCDAQRDRLADLREVDDFEATSIAALSRLTPLRRMAA